MCSRKHSRFTPDVYVQIRRHKISSRPRLNTKARRDFIPNIPGYCWKPISFEHAAVRRLVEWKKKIKHNTLVDDGISILKVLKNTKVHKWFCDYIYILQLRGTRRRCGARELVFRPSLSIIYTSVHRCDPNTTERT